MKLKTLFWKQRLAFVMALGLSLAVVVPSSGAIGRQGTVEFLYVNYNIGQSPAPIGTLFTEIYGKAGSVIGLALSSTLVWNFDLYLEIKQINRTGKLTYSGEKTTVLLIPISLGVRYVQPLGIVQPYLGGGLDFYLFYEDNPIGSVFNYVRGSHVLGGTYVQFSKSVPVMLDFRVKYTSATATVNERQVQLGGLEYGAGFVIAF
jgi:hypothetical protein